MTQLDTVKTKAGEFDVKQTGLGVASASSQTSRPNRYTETEIENPRTGIKVRLRATFEAALEIEDQLGGLDGLRIRAASGGVPGIPGLTTRDFGVIIAAGAKAAGDERANPQNAAEFAYKAGRDALRKPISDFIKMLINGGQLRLDDLGNGASPSASLGDSGESETTALMTEIASRSDDFSE